MCPLEVMFHYSHRMTSFQSEWSSFTQDWVVATKRGSGMPSWSQAVCWQPAMLFLLWPVCLTLTAGYLENERMGGCSSVDSGGALEDPGRLYVGHCGQAGVVPLDEATARVRMFCAHMQWCVTVSSHLLLIPLGGRSFSLP